MSKAKTSGISIGSIIAIALIMAAAMFAFVFVQDRGSVSPPDSNLELQVEQLQQELQDARETANRTPSASPNIASSDTDDLWERIREIEAKNRSLASELKDIQATNKPLLSRKFELEQIMEALKTEKDRLEEDIRRLETISKSIR